MLQVNIIRQSTKERYSSTDEYGKSGHCDDVYQAFCQERLQGLASVYPHAL